MMLAVLTGWLDRQERLAIAYLMEENRVLRRQLGQQRLQFTAGVSDVLHGVRNRPRITAGPDCRVDAVSKMISSCAKSVAC
jgi:hypothetical protein